MIGIHTKAGVIGRTWVNHSKTGFLKTRTEPELDPVETNIFRVL